MWNRFRRRFAAAARRQASGYELNLGGRRAQLESVEYGSPADTRIEIFWKDLRGFRGADARLAEGVGPVLSFIVRGIEVMRFDCLGACGHYHVAMVRPDPTAEIRLWFRERTAPEQVERAAFELERNIDYYLPRNPLRSVRSAQIRRDEHRSRCSEARAAALALWERNNTAPRAPESAC
ncbi:MAG: hypothetical protein PVF91_03800 [Chromatiales bacterium]|jgi:hypothetical protein